VSMRFTPNSTARRSIRRASSGSSGSPRIPFPVRRMAPGPKRLTTRSSPRANVPAAAASGPAFWRSSCSHIDFDQGKAIQTALTDNPDNSGNLGRVVPFDYLTGFCVGTVVHIPPFAPRAPSRGYRG
jgi:hypothetical protein